MKHGRSDYNGRIIDLASLIKDGEVDADHLSGLLAAIEANPPAHPIPADEPVFVLRASDSIAAHIVREYARFQRQQGGSWLDHERVIAQAEAMEAYANAHGAKLPDSPTA